MYNGGEKEYRNSPHDMEIITMWAESRGVHNADKIANPTANVQNVISDVDAAKIRKDVENAIEIDDRKLTFFEVTSNFTL